MIRLSVAHYDEDGNWTMFRTIGDPIAYYRFKCLEEEIVEFILN